MLRGIRRLFFVLAIGWVLLMSWVFIPDRGMHSDAGVFEIIVVGGLVVYSIGWLITYLMNGFRPRHHRPIIDVTPRQRR